MKQIIQNLKTGETLLADVPSPQVKPGYLIIRTQNSLISIGTERMLVEFGKANLIEKARQQPEKVKQVLNKIKTEGLFSTVEAVRSRLDQPLPLGYCNAGIVVEVGRDVAGFQVGDRVASNGAHAEIVCVPQNLCAKIPDTVDFDDAAFTVVGAIALHGVRLLQPTLGENIVVIGLGLIGLMAVQILQVHGCRVLGFDMKNENVELARELGVEAVHLSEESDAFACSAAFAGSVGVDGVLITAATKSSEPINNAARFCRKRGRIVQVGATGMQLERSIFYEKELTFQVSCSYGPGRYDPEYEEKGRDYPFPYVRWTEKRNFEAMLRLMADRKLQVKPLVSHRFSIDRADEAYELVHRGGGRGIILEYPHAEQTSTTTLLNRRIAIAATPRGRETSIVCGVIGAGTFSSLITLPILEAAQVRLKTIVSSGGVTGTHQGKKHGFEESATDPSLVFNDPDINVVFITTRHNSHAEYVIRALEAGKHVFVEKPLCLTREELERIQATYEKSQVLLMIGFNRRFSPHIQKLKQLLAAQPQAKTFIMTVNAGIIPDDHWHHDPRVGGGRILAEGCHFIDLLRHLAGNAIVDVRALMLGENGGNLRRDDKTSISLRFADGSIGTVHYFGNGSKRFPKERLEVFGGGGIIQLDNFRAMYGFDWPGFRRMKIRKQDKGHRQAIVAFLESIREGKPSPIAADEIFEVMDATFEAVEQAF